MARDEDKPRMPQAQHRGGKDKKMVRQKRKHPYTGEEKGKLVPEESIRIGNGPKKRDKRAQDLKADQASRPKGGQHAKSGCAVVFFGSAAALTALGAEKVLSWLA
jgi:hypothetical protein